MTKPVYRVRADGTVRVNDGFVNLASNLGTGRDKAASGGYQYVPIAAFALMNMYRSSWLAKKMVNIPAQDATRRWRAWQAEAEQISAIEALEKRLDLQDKVKQAVRMARLFGGAALYFGLRNQDPSEPLDLDRVRAGDLESLTLMSRYQLNPVDPERDPTSPFWGHPKYFELVAMSGDSVRIHPSRLAIFRGEAISTSDPSEWLWGDGILQAAQTAVLQGDSLAANVSSLVYEANVDVIHIPRLMEMMRDQESENKVLTYLRTLAMVKGNNGMLVLDGGDTSETEGNSGGTKYDRKSISFTGLSDVWDRFMQMASAASDIPVSRLFGRSAAGLNSTGEGDMKNYHESVTAIQATYMQPAMANLDEALIRSALNNRDEDIYYEWRSLQEPSDKERAEHGKAVADIIKVLRESELFPEETLQAIAVSALTETGALPGIEAAVLEHGLELEEDPEDDPRLQLSALGRNKKPSPALRVVDAAPKPLYVQRKVSAASAKAIKQWALEQGFKKEDLVEDLHVTIAYSRAPIDWMKVEEDYSEFIDINPGGPRALEVMGAQDKVVALQFASRQLQYRHADIIERGASWDWPDYQPHITIARGDKIPDGASPFAGTFRLEHEIFEDLKE